MSIENGWGQGDQVIFVSCYKNGCRAILSDLAHGRSNRLWRGLDARGRRNTDNSYGYT